MILYLLLLTLLRFLGVFSFVRNPLDRFLKRLYTRGVNDFQSSVCQR